jgi:hypothetical protein
MASPFLLFPSATLALAFKSKWMGQNEYGQHGIGF